MVQKLSVQIELQGAEQIKQQFAEIGAEGVAAFKALSKAADDVGGFAKLDPTEVTKKLEDLGITGEESINQINEALQQASNLETIVSNVEKLEVAFGAVGKVIRPLSSDFRKVQQAGAALVNLLGTTGAIAAGGFLAVAAAIALATKAAIDFSAQITKVDADAQNLGLTVEQFDKLRLGFEKAGLSAQAVSEGIANFAAQLDKVKGKTEVVTDFTAGFQSTGDAAKDAEEFLKQFIQTAGVGMQPVKQTATEILPAVIEKLRQMPDTAQRAQLAIGLFAKTAGPELVQAFRTGAISFDQFLDAQKAFTQQQVNQASVLEQAINRLKAAWTRGDISAVFSNLGSIVKIQFNSLVSDLNALDAASLKFFTSLTGFNWDSFSSGAIAAWNAVVGAVQEAVSAVSKFLAFDDFNWDSVSQGAIDAWNAVVGAVQGAGTAIANFISSLTGITWDSIAQGAISAWNSVVGAIQAAGQAIIDFVSSIGSITWDTISSLGVAAWNAITNAIQGAIDKVLEFIGLKPSGGAGAGAGAGGLAGGGLIGGSGTGTSDSNLAWVSRGEHIMPAGAVAQPGVLAFLEALRRSGGNLSRVLDGMGRFALGGLVPRAMPVFASGGLVGGMSSVTIQFPGLPPITGLRASSATVDELRRTAALAQVRSGGRKPSRYS